MYTVPELVKVLGLSTENQVRNRIEAIRDLLAGHIRRGPNNQILLTQEGLALLRDVHVLCESGQTLAEAARIMRYRAEEEAKKIFGGADEAEQIKEKPGERGDEGWRVLVAHLAQDMRRLEERVAALEAAVARQRGHLGWWERWR